MFLIQTGTTSNINVVKHSYKLNHVLKTLQGSEGNKVWCRALVLFAQGSTFNL